MISTPPWTSHWRLAVWTRWESHIKNLKKSLEDQERGWLTLSVSIPTQCQRNIKSQGMSSNISGWRTFQRLLGSLKIAYKRYERWRPKHEPNDSYFYLIRHITKCMMIDDSLNLKNYPVRTEIIGRQQIPISHVCFTDKRKSKEFLTKKTYGRSLLQTKANQKSLSLKCLLRRVNHNAFTKS